MTIAQEFKDAMALHSADEVLFQPLIEKFEELKKVLESNFRIKKDIRKWYGKHIHTDNTVISMSIEDKISHSSGKYLFIRINGYSYVMGIGQVGDLKDRVYFCEGASIYNTVRKTVVYITSGMFGTTDYCLEHHLSCVQLFSELIKRYKQYLVVN